MVCTMYTIMEHIRQNHSNNLWSIMKMDNDMYIEGTFKLASIKYKITQQSVVIIYYCTKYIICYESQKRFD